VVVGLATTSDVMTNGAVARPRFDLGLREAEYRQDPDEPGVAQKKRW